MSNKFSEEDIQIQCILEADHWYVLLPRGPYSAFHLLFITKNNSTELFDQLNDEQALELRDLIKYMAKKMTKEFGKGFLGYNLFSNNGDKSIGQHMKHFHQHIFLRLLSEESSPYAAMATNQKWINIGTKEWSNHHKILIDLFRR